MNPDSSGSEPARARNDETASDNDNEVRRDRKRPFRTLIAEDEAIAAMDLQEMITEMGGEVIAVAKRGEDAIDLAKAHDPDIVLMDVHLFGNVDGVEAARVIRSKKRTPVVFVTAHGDAQTLQRMFAIVPQAPVIKPITAQRLRTAIQAALQTDL